MREKIKEKSTAIGLDLIVIGVMIQPAAAWGLITHLAITTELNGDVPDQVTKYPKFTIGGAVGADMFYFLPWYEDYSVLAHTKKTADLPREMLRLANTDSWIFRNQKKAYAYGWLSHHADLIGHTKYVNIKVMNPPSHEDVELGVDANLADEVSDPSIYVPYGLVQKAYQNTYQVKPELATIISAATIEQVTLYIEKVLILAGTFDDLKNTYNDFRNFNGQDVYGESISYSKSAIQYPADLPNLNLYTGGSPENLLASGIVENELVSSALTKANHNKVDPDIRDTANKLLRNGVIEVPVQDDKINEILYVGKPVIKNKKAFDDAISELVIKKKGKK